MGLYMYYPGLKGDATEQGFKDWITLDSVHFGTSRSVAASVGSTAGREASVPNISEITVTKHLDASSAGLFRASVTLSKGQTVNIAFTRTGAQGEAYLKYQLDDVLITGYSISTAGDRPVEQVSISCAKFQMTVTTTDSSNNPLAPMTTGYDLAQNTPV
jgi:type VI secretion system secreted protein Hcp